MQIKNLLDCAHEQARTFVDENPRINFREVEELFDGAFFYYLSRHIGEVTIAEMSTVINGARDLPDFFGSILESGPSVASVE
ncbi:hypothetical protein AB4Y45_45655 [Paraburkholderia sp. EG287A]|uniref:hypothetical protein n=1 Tax=unclassified Paraburkholderia TaxID=2615204 RepID=UPI0034D2EAF2